MGRRKADPVNPKKLQGFKYFAQLDSLLRRLHEDGIDKAGNRQFFFDQFAVLVLFYFFNPAITSLRGLQQASELEKVQKTLGCSRVSLGSLSEAADVFNPQLLEGIIAELGQRVPAAELPREQQALKDLVAVDGSLLPALPRMFWALWVDEQHKAAKMHLHFEVLRGIPVAARVTAGNASETQQLRLQLQAGVLYVIDRGYAEYKLFQDIIDARSSFVGRIRDNAVWELVEQRPVSAEAKAAGVISDRVVKLGGEQSGKAFKQPLRVLEVATGKTDTQGRPEVLLLCTDRLDLPAELVALAYKYRWSVELFFRWFKCVVGRRHLLFESQNGVQLQVYLALIATLLISLYVGKNATKRTFEMFCLYFAGWASEAEVEAHIRKLQEKVAARSAPSKPSADSS